MRSLVLGTVLGAVLWALLPATVHDVPSPDLTPAEAPALVQTAGVEAPADPDAAVPGPAAGLAPAPAPGPAVLRLRDAVDRVLDAPGWRRAHWGVLAVSLDRGDTLVAREPARIMIPASNLKLLTTAAAFHHLGPEYRWVTLALADGGIRDGILQGDLVLYGTGDPGLSERFHDTDRAVFDTLAARLRADGLRAIAGRVLGDGTFFRGPARHGAWDPEDRNQHYAAAAGALSWAENVVTLRIEATRSGVPPMIHGLPALGGVDVRNDARTAAGAPSPRLSVDREAPLDPIRIAGELAPGAPDVWRRMNVQDPGLYAAHAFHAALERAGIAITGPPGVVSAPESSTLDGVGLFRGAAEEPQVLARHVSPPLREYLTVINHESHNLFADVVLKTLGRAVAGEGTFEAGARVVERFLTDVVGAAEGSVYVLDGSGLASGNRVSPETIVGLLGYMAGRDDGEAFLATLPQAGTRDLRRMDRTAAARNLRAKTGTIHGVSALSGLVRTASGERVAFSIIGNELPSTWGAKRLEDRIGAYLAALDRDAPADGDAALSASAVPDGRDGSR
jgi:D-alanyl-D-alanine carboxypeptidase/D-alanyl-D-alanine-endopeptidase (penicillin-binding protein 4)